MKQLIVFVFLSLFVLQVSYGQLWSGIIATPNGEAIQYAKVTLATAVDTFEFITGQDGNYSFPLLPAGTSGTITVKRGALGDQVTNGLSPYDITLIQKLSAGVISISEFSPYQIIAGDINNNGYWSTFDAWQIYQILIGSSTTYLTAPHWKFVRADYEFDDPLNPILTDEISSFSFDDMTTTEAPSFIGVRSGDVNTSVIPHD